jgi:hypothetical protein
LAVADPVQDGQSAEVFFDDAIVAGGALANTVAFSSAGQLRAFIVIRDDVILGRESIVRISDGTRAPVTLQGVVVHERPRFGFVFTRRATPPALRFHTH